MVGLKYISNCGTFVAYLQFEGLLSVFFGMSICLSRRHAAYIYIYMIYIYIYMIYIYIYFCFFLDDFV